MLREAGELLRHSGRGTRGTTSDPIITPLRRGIRTPGSDRLSVRHQGVEKGLSTRHARVRAPFHPVTSEKCRLGTASPLLHEGGDFCASLSPHHPLFLRPDPQRFHLPI